MPDLININTDEAAKKLSIINKNTLLVVSICFALSIVYLYVEQVKQNNRMIEYLTQDVVNTTKVIEHNSTTLQENNHAIVKLTDAIERNNQRSAEINNHIK
jgi:CRISPR/Cas system CSM-associated protein Csm5 (group 7 of RAMP superfamily)